MKNKRKHTYGIWMMLCIMFAVTAILPGKFADAATKNLSDITAVYTGDAVKVGYPIEAEKLTVMGLFTDGSYEKLTDYTVSSYIVEREGSNRIRVTYDDMSTYFTVQGKTVVYLDAYYESQRVTVGESIDRNKLTVNAYYSDGSDEKVTDYVLSHTIVKTLGQNVITVSYENASAKLYITGVQERKPVELYAAYIGPSVIEGNAPKRSDFYVSILYNDNTMEEITTFELTPSIVQKEGKNTMVVSVGNLSEEVTVTGLAKTVESITAEYVGFPVVIGKTLATEDIIVTATFNDGTKDTVTNFTLSSSVVYQIGDNLITVFCDGETAYINVRGVEAEIIDYENSAQALIKDNKVSSKVVLAVGQKADPEKVHIDKIDTQLVKKAMRRLVQTDKFMAFEVSFEDPELDVFLPMTMKVSVPAGYDKENFAVFYTPNRKTIMAEMNGEFLSDGNYEFKIFQPGTYIIADVTPLVYVESLMFEEESLTLRVGRSYSLDPVILPHTATNKEVTYTSSRPQIVSVSERGILTALKTGTSIITVEAKDGSGKTGRLRVSVVEKKGKFDAEIVALADMLDQVETAYDFLDFYDYLVEDTIEKSYELSERQFSGYVEELLDWIEGWGEGTFNLSEEEWEELLDMLFDWTYDEWGLLEDFLSEYEGEE